MSRSDPTRTKGITRRWFREIDRRWKEFDSRISGVLRQSGQVTNAFEIDDSRIRLFLVYYQQQIDALLMGTVSAPNWQARYQLQSYERAIERGRAQLIAQGLLLTPTAEEVLQATDLDVDFIVTPSLVATVTAPTVAAPIHQESLDFLYTRSYSKLKKWTDDMAIDTRQVLTDGVRQGKGIRELQREIQALSGSTVARAQLIARTETIQAYQRSTVAQAEQLSIDLGEEVRLRWITTRGSRVRDLHAKWHGNVITTQEARRRLQVSPWNCECALFTVLLEFNTVVAQEKFDKERKTLLALEKQAA